MGVLHISLGEALRAPIVKGRLDDGSAAVRNTKWSAVTEWFAVATESMIFFL